MQQNAAAYKALHDVGHTLFNEAAFERGEAIYDGEIAGVAFRSVAKTFQVSVWRRLQEQWSALDEEARQRLGAVLDAGKG